MKRVLFVKQAILTTVLVLMAVASWEIYLRHKGVPTDFDDNDELWANKRAMVYEPADKATVFIGSSRIKYDLDIPTWEKITGKHAIQLAMVGSSPRLFLTDLANDPKFKGKLIIDVTEVLFFSQAPRVDLSPIGGINYYKNITPARRASFVIDRELESRLAFLNQDFFSLNALLDHLYIPNRNGVYAGLDFPMGFGSTMFNRQTKMTDQFLADTNLQNKVRGICRFVAKLDPTPPVKGKALLDIMQTVKSDIDKIRARGGDVLFLRTPSSGPFLMGENMGYPRTVYFDKLLEFTGCKGIHFADYPALNHFICPEFSHLKPSDAVIYTKNMIDIIKKDKKWDL
jgi:hypothetical protein